MVMPRHDVAMRATLMPCLIAFRLAFMIADATLYAAKMPMLIRHYADVAALLRHYADGIPPCRAAVIFDYFDFALRCRASAGDDA